MRNISKKMAVVLASTAVGVLALGGLSSASAEPVPVHGQFVHHHRHGTPPLSGTVASVGTGSFTLTGADGTSVTVDVTSSTTYAETGTATAPTGVAGGERVLVTPARGTSSTATRVTAARVLIVLDQVSGTVRTVGTGSFTVFTPGGLTLTVDTTPSTTYTENGATEAGVTAGESVSAFGAPDATDPSQLDARFVDVRPAPGTTAGHPWPTHPGHTPGWTPSKGTTSPGTFVTGKVRSVTGDDIVVVRSSGSTTTVVVSSTTRYLGTSGADSLAAVTDGVTITTFGTSGGSGVIDAQVVLIGGLPTFPKPGGSGSGSWPAGGPKGGPTPPATAPWTPPSNHPTDPGSGTPTDPGVAHPGWSAGADHPATSPVTTTSTGAQQGPGARGPQVSPGGPRPGGWGSPTGPGSRG